MLDLGTSFLACAERMPTARAIVEGDVSWTYAALRDKTLSVLAALRDVGIRHGDRVVTALQNRRETVLVHWACQLGGFVVTPVNWRVRPEELDYALQNSEAVAVVYEEVTAETVRSANLAGSVRQIAVGDAAADDGAHRLDEMLACAPAEAVSAAGPDDISIMLYTSGTTGRGKGVPRRHRAERAAAVAHLAQNQYGRGEVTLGVMPLYHTMGVRSLISMCLINGLFICQPRFNVEETLRLIEAERITSLYLVPTLYHDLVHSPAFAQTEIGSVKKLGYAGATMTDGLLLRLSELFKPSLFVNHYGSSEIYTFTIESDAPSKPGSAGKAGLNQRIRVVQLNGTGPDDLADANEEGEIIATMRSDEAFEGYWRRPEADEKAIRDGWYFTGDIGYLDDDGDLFVTGRVDDMIISGGENILPAEIESVLSLHDAVGEVAVVGLADERLGSRVAAFVQRISAVSEADLDAWCKQSDLASFKRPRTYVFVKEIPKSPVGKLLRRKLTAGEYEAETEAKE
ncbi:MAG: AMP-binding protein [Pseudomonadota bacterium]